MSETIPTTNFLDKEKCCGVCHRHIQSKRLTLGFLLKDALKNIFNLERGLFYTIKEVLIRPEVVIQDYLRGDRYRYMNPFRFLLTAATLYALVVSIFGFSIGDFVEPDDQNPLNPEVLANYTNLIILFNVPFAALGSWLAFRPAKLNYAEHLVVNAYAYSLMTFLTIPLDIIFSALIPSFDMYWEIASSPLMLFVTFYVYIKTLSKSLVAGILRSILSIICVIIIALIIIIPVAFIIKMNTA